MSVSRVSSEEAGPSEFVAQLEDVSEITRLSERLAAAAPSDALTGLACRRAFLRDLALQVGRCRRYNEKAALVLLDIDDFGEFNQAHGRAAGDAELVAVAGALRERLRATDVVARVGSDEFAVLLPRAQDAPEVVAALREAVDAMRVPNGTAYARVSVSVGVQVLDRTTLSGDVVLGELERSTLAPPSSAPVRYPSRAAATSRGLRATQWIRRRLGVSAVAIAAASGAAYGIAHGIATIVGHQATVQPTVAPRTAVLRVSSQNVGISTSGRFTVRLQCSGSLCRGVLAVSTTGPRARTTRRVSTEVMANARFSIASGSTIAAPVRLNAAGRRLFVVANGRRAANLTAALDGGPGYSQALSVRLVRAGTRLRAPNPTLTSTATGPAAAAVPLPSPSVDGSGSGPDGSLPLAPVGPCTAVDVVPGATSAAQTLSSTLCLINAQRTAAGLQGLHENSRLDEAAAAHNADMVAKDYFAHVSPTGVGPLNWVTASGYVLPSIGYVIGENIGWGTFDLATPRSMVSAWMNSPDHRANILNPSYTDSGIAVSTQLPASLGLGQPGGLYTENFGGATG